jgi:hypothetical protein
MIAVRTELIKATEDTIWGKMKRIGTALVFVASSRRQAERVGSTHRREPAQARGESLIAESSDR